MLIPHMRLTLAVLWENVEVHNLTPLNPICSRYPLPINASTGRSFTYKTQGHHGTLIQSLPYQSRIAFYFNRILSYPGLYWSCG